MWLWDWILGRDSVTTSVAAEAVEPSVVFSTDIPTPIDKLLSSMKSADGTRASRTDALSVTAVLRGRNLICSISTLPLVTINSERIPVRSPFLEQIDPNVANVVTISQTLEDLLFEGIAWWRITERNSAGFPLHAIRVSASAVSTQPPAGVSEQTLPSGFQPGGTVWVNGERVAGRNMIRFDSPNPGILGVAGRSIRRAVTLEKVAVLYGDDPRMLDYFSPADGADPVEDEDIQEILDDWQEARRRRATGYVPAALEYNTVNSLSPADLQLVELQKKATIDLANAMGVDPEDLGVSTTSRTYQNATDRRRDRINDTLAPYMRAITDRLSMNDVTRRGQATVFNLDDYMKADPTTRWGTYAIGIDKQIVSQQEVRKAEGLPAIPVEGQIRPPAAPRQTETTSQADQAAAIGEKFMSDTTTMTFEAPAAEFRVDAAKRTVKGLLIPWGKIANNGWARWRFEPGSLEWGETSRVKLNRDHDRQQAVGVAMTLTESDEGVEGTFKVARGDEGDRVLSLAEDGVLDGFSVEVNGDGFEWAADPDDELVRLVSHGKLAGVAITASPAFDDARVSGVAASRNNKKELVMADEAKETKGAPAESGAESKGGEQFAAPDFSALTDAVETFAGAVTQLGQIQSETAERPAVVDPTQRPTTNLSVNEEPLYRFDGTQGKYDFSSDIIAGAKGEYDAMKRAQDFLSENFAINQAGVAGLNPDRQRPDLYVDQLEFMTPIFTSINKGTIADNTPFVLPKFDASSGLVGDHSEGTEPTAGALTATSQTITPSPVSGKVEVTREAWDQGGNPQLSTILWRQMVRAYDESLEQASADMLDGLTVTEIDLGSAVDATLASDLKEALAALHFVRGGNRFRDFKLEQGLYTALASAEDGDGRPLFPILSPSNADGRTDAFFGSIAVGGLAGIPSWALPETQAGTPPTPGNSYLYNREDVNAWASAPQRLDFEYRVAFVDVAIWGYKALAATRTDGVRRVTYDSIS